MNSLKKIFLLITLPACWPVFGMQSTEIMPSPSPRRRTAAIPLLETLPPVTTPMNEPVNTEEINQSSEKPTNELSKQLRRRRKKKKPLRIEILKREAHKADMNRRILFKQDYINSLYEKYEITETQKMPLRKILRLSEAQKDKRIMKIRARNIKLYKKFCEYTKSIHSFINEKEFTKASNTFRSVKLLEFVACDPAIDEKSSTIYFIQHARTVMSAIVWATQETMDKYDLNKENNEDEIQ